jgi:hypothetical protein
MPAPLPLGDAIPAGDLHRRCALNFSRLHDEPFRFDAMVKANTAAEAPGDWIGRAMLGLSVLGQTLRFEPPTSTFAPTPAPAVASAAPPT